MSKLNRRRGKELERFVAKFFKGRRVGVLGCEDLLFQKFSGECKERQCLPASIKKWMKQAEQNKSGHGKIPFIYLHENSQSHKDDLVICKAEDFREFILWKEGMENG